MTERKPPFIPKETWVERQIREAQERGDFDNLPGAGKPLPNLDRPFSVQQWAADWARREGGELPVMLPPLLALRKERSGLLAALDQVQSEGELRELVTDFNRRLLAQYRQPLDGPLVAVGVIDVEDTVSTWREHRPAEPPPTEPLPAPKAARRRWWRRAR